MTVERLIAFTKIVKGELKTLGTSWENLVYEETSNHQNWTAPPLIVEGSVFNCDIKHLFKVLDVVTLDEFVRVYEDYVFLCAETGVERQSYLVKNLRLKGGVASSYLPRYEPTDCFNCLPALAAYAYYNYEGTIELIGYSSLVVSVGVYKFGLRYNAPVNNRREIPLRERKADVTKPPVTTGRRKDCELSPLTERFSSILCGLEKLQVPAETLSEFSLAFSLLIMNDCEALRRLWGLDKKDPNNLHPLTVGALMKRAKQFREYERPIEFLYELLVPFLFNRVEFFNTFGRDQELRPERVRELNSTIDNLVMKYNKEREEICL